MEKHVVDVVADNYIDWRVRVVFLKIWLQTDGEMPDSLNGLTISKMPLTNTRTNLYQTIIMFLHSIILIAVDRTSWATGLRTPILQFISPSTMMRNLEIFP